MQFQDKTELEVQFMKGIVTAEDLAAVSIHATLQELETEMSLIQGTNLVELSETKLYTHALHNIILRRIRQYKAAQAAQAV